MTPAQQAFRGIALALNELKVQGYDCVEAEYMGFPRGIFGSNANANAVGQPSVLYDALAGRGRKCYGGLYGYRGKDRLFRFQAQFNNYGYLPGFNRKVWIQFPCSFSGPDLVRDGPVIEGGQSRLFTPKTVEISIDDEKTLFRHGLEIDSPGVVTAIAIDWTGPPTQEQARRGVLWMAEQIAKEIKAGDQLLAQAQLDQQIFSRLASSIKRKNGRRRAPEMAQLLLGAYEGVKPPELVASLIAHELTKTA